MAIAGDPPQLHRRRWSSKLGRTLSGTARVGQCAGGSVWDPVAMMLGGRASLIGQATEGVLMSDNPVQRTNLAAITCDPRPQLPDGFRRDSTRVGAALGAARTGLSVYELPPGQAISPYHYENPDEEWLLVVSGTPTLRHPGGEEQLEPWDIVFFPSGPAGAHLVRNTSESTARVAMFSSKAATVGAVVYPDSDMVWVWTDDEAVDLVVKRSSAEDDIAPWTTGTSEAER
jgi:uncharacterized cupin superfamily protein